MYQPHGQTKGGDSLLVSSLIAWCNRIYEPDATSYKISDAQWISFFNESLNDLKPYLKLKELSTADLVSDRADYGLPGDFYRMYLLRVKPTSTGDYETYEEIMIEDDYSTGYKLWEFITIQPEPTVSITDGLKMYYYKTHADLSVATDNIEISNPYLVGLYALGRVETGDRVLDMSNRYFREYAEGVQKLKVNDVKPYEDYSIRDVY